MVYQDSYYLSHLWLWVDSSTWNRMFYCVAIPTFLDACSCSYTHTHPFLVAISVVYQDPYHFRHLWPWVGSSTCKAFPFLPQLIHCPVVSQDTYFPRHLWPRLHPCTCDGTPVISMVDHAHITPGTCSHRYATESMLPYCTIHPSPVYPS